jgi:hypothetical protein
MDAPAKDAPSSPLVENVGTKRLDGDARGIIIIIVFEDIK